MGLLEQIYEKAKENPQRIAFPEAVNEKMMQAAYETGKRRIHYSCACGKCG